MINTIEKAKIMTIAMLINFKINVPKIFPSRFVLDKKIAHY